MQRYITFINQKAQYFRAYFPKLTCVVKNPNRVQLEVNSKGISKCNVYGNTKKLKETKNKVGGCALTDAKTYFEIVIGLWIQIIGTEQRPEIDPHMYIQSFFTKDLRPLSQRKSFERK